MMLRTPGRSAVARQLATASTRAYGTSLPVPTPPPGYDRITGTPVFHSATGTPKYSLSNPKWFALFFVMNAGAYAGHYFYLKLLMPVNPPNPPRNPNEVAPEVHMHAVDED